MSASELSLPVLGLMIVDHGSRRQESNDMLLEVVRRVEALGAYPIVEPAHMDLAEPSIATAFSRCVERGAELVVVHPFFLLPGRHWAEDIPARTAAAAAHHPGVRFLVTAPLGLHPSMATIVDEQVQRCLACAAGSAPPCEACIEEGGCRFAGGARPEAFRPGRHGT